MLRREPHGVPIPVLADHAQRSHAPQPVKILNQQRLGPLPRRANAGRSATRAASDDNDIIAPQHRKSPCCRLYHRQSPVKRTKPVQDFTHLPSVPCRRSLPSRHGNHPLKLPRRGIGRGLTADHRPTFHKGERTQLPRGQARTASHNQEMRGHHCHMVWRNLE